MNKVLQAAGRVIRTEKDKGVILLIDDRFGQYSYQRIFPKEWRKCIQVSSVKRVENELRMFWNRKRELI